MSPTVFRYKGYRFYFFSREERCMHVHVWCGDGEAKFWLSPSISLAQNYGLTQKQLTEAAEIIGDRKDEIAEAWQKHFAG